jgi:hypothetical protein
LTQYFLKRLVTRCFDFDRLTSVAMLRFVAVILQIYNYDNNNQTSKLAKSICF